MIFVNFKTYTQAMGEEAVKLGEICAQIKKAFGIPVIPVVQALDIYRVASALKIPVWVQHLDWQPPGPFTGFVNLEAVVREGGKGAILNHAEHKLPLRTIKRIVKRVRKFNFSTHNHFQLLLCCRSLGQAQNYVKLKPDFLAYEPPELIGGEISVSEFNPAAIRHFVKICEEIPAIIGAGIKNKNDVKIGRKLGAKGILVSSHVVLAENPREVLEDLAGGFL